MLIEVSSAEVLPVMNIKHLTTKISGFVLPAFFLLGLVAVAGTSAQAQDRGNRGRDRQERRDSNRNWDRNRDGNRDRRDWNRDRSARNRDRGDWNRDRRVYTTPRNYGYYGNGSGYGYGNGYGYGAAAQSQGYQEGFYTGQSDASRGQSYDPQRSHYFRNQRGNGAYENGFLRGYAEGWRSVGGRRW